MPQTLPDGHPILAAQMLAGVSRDLANGMEHLYDVWLDTKPHISPGTVISILADKLDAIADLSEEVRKALILTEVALGSAVGPDYKSLKQASQKTPVVVRGGWQR